MSIRAVADAVGVSSPSIYLHFADKNALLFAVCEEHFRGLATAMARDVSGIDDPVARVRARGGSYVDWALANPELYRILFMRSAAEEPPDVDLAGLLSDSGFGDVFQDVTAAAEQGRVAFPPLQASRLLWTSVHGVASLMIAKPEFTWGDREALVHDLLEMVARGVFPAGVEEGRGPGRSVDGET